MSTIKNHHPHSILDFNFEGKKYKIFTDKLDFSDDSLDYWSSFVSSKDKILDINIWVFEGKPRFTILKDYKVLKSEKLKIK